MRHYRSKRRRTGNNKLVKLYVTRGNHLIDCWSANKPYETLDGFKVYQKWATGDGFVARHLCGNSKCWNPLHLVRGTDIENAQDELDIRDFSLELFEEMINDYSLRDLDIENDLKFLVIIPRATVALRQSHGFMYMKETINYGRERFRIEYVNKLTNNILNGEMPEKLLERLKNAEVLFEALRQRVDIEIIPVMEGL